MATALARVTCFLVLIMATNAAPYRVNGWDDWCGNRHRADATSYSGCNDQFSDTAVLSSGVTLSPTDVLSGLSTTFTLPDSSPAPEAFSSVTETVSILLTTTSSIIVEPTVSSATSTASPVASAVVLASTSESDVQAWLDGHNSLRQQHGTSNLTWSDSLASVAQDWADGCMFKHSGSEFGENLYAGTGAVVPISDAVFAWASEAGNYNPSNPTYSHFTQMVWKATTELGCALARCDGIFDASYGKASYYVCEYNPAGNVIGAFDENVQV